MNPISSFIKRYPQVVFWGIAYSIGSAGYILSRLYPNDLWILILWGIFLAGALVTAIADGRSGLKTYFSRLVRWRAGIKWYAIALLAPFVLHLISIGLNLLSGAEIYAGFQFPDLSQVVVVFLFSFFTIALGEEPGFRGFALPRLMSGRSAFAASLILGALHAIWHLPLVIGGDETISIFLNVIGGAVLITWIFNHTNGSVFIAMLLHATTDLTAALFNPAFSGTDAVMARIWLAGAFVAVAILLRILAGSELGRKPEAAMDTMPAGQALAAD